MTSSASRREFLRRAGAFSLLGPAAPLALNLAALGSASAQSTGDYKAIVCLFLFGGNDTYNTVLATDAASWANYQSVRNQAPDPIALKSVGTVPVGSAAAGSPDRLGGVLALNPINAQGRSFAVHPQLVAARDLFNAGRLAIVPNAGPLIAPTTKADYKNAGFAKPASLFSHNDQQSTWQTLAAEGATTGWGGRMGDLLASQNGRSVFTSVSASGNAVWLSGQQVLQYQVSTGGAIRIGGSGNTLFGSAVALEKMRSIMRTARLDSALARDHAGAVGRSIDAEASFSAALPSATTAPFGTPGATGTDPLLQYDNPITGAKATNNLAQQLQVVARTIAARGTLGMKRQVFFVSLGGFDTHDFQNRNHADLMARLSHGLAYFDAVLGAMGVRDSVTTFTASDFGRTFTSNGDGTDHGWGAHHLVMGGAVKGRDLYGNFPAYGLPDGKGDFTSPNQLSNGALLPETSVEQVGATLGRWFGLSDSQLLDLFPRLSNFDAARRNLGFLA
ncbi:DUF1501 domain-containing protein [Ideonella sp. BN130291]|uniref:DUF1501 domain-containing protein n=1 Tax=Ideonella sp. BN130291 TaxID=3112940 RepID=UPI002E255FAE|nr:DUF1501 domain-containing protein [Ideonella sp. BN130291]